MTFEQDFLEKFPSLKGHVTPEVREKNVIIRAAWVNTDNIQKFCLDKSKVKQAINECMSIEGVGIVKSIRLELLKELGL